jgi:quaternary ammonium compound-resistance protein SugE
MACKLAANPRELRPSGQPHDTPSANLPPRWADRQDGSGELGAPGWLDPGGISMMGGLGIWRTKSLLSGASCRSFSAWSGGGVRGQEQPGGRRLLVLRQRGERGDVMAWLIVLAAGLFETGFAVLLKLSHGLTKMWPTAGFAACALISFALLTVALRELEVGAAYAVWTGIGAAGAAAVGMIFLGDAVSALKLASIGLVLAGVVGLNLSGVTPS